MRKKIILVIFLMIVVSVLNGCEKEDTIDVGGEPEIVLLVDSFDGYFNQNSTATYYWKHYMIINADEDDV